jgi:hypothetical protein
MLRGKIVRLVLQVVLDDATDDQRGEPLVQVRCFGDLLPTWILLSCAWFLDLLASLISLPG